MARVRVGKHMLEELLFGYSPNDVTVHGLEFDSLSQSVIFTVSGPDIPEDASEVQALCQIKTNRAGQRFITMTFPPVK